MLLEYVVALFLDISPVIKLLSEFRTRPGHISRTLEANETLVDIQTEACSHSSGRASLRLL